MEKPPLTARERRRRDRRVWRAAFAASLVVHALIALFLGDRSAPLSPFAAAGPAENDDRAAAGSMQAVNVRARAATPVTPVPIPVPVEVEIDPVEFEPEPPTEPAEIVGDAPGLDAPGTQAGAGDAQGDAGTGEEGRNRLNPPVPRGMIIPPASGENLRGRSVEVWVFVDARGRVVADSTQLRPPTPDRRYNQRLIREAAEWVFQPATRGGQAVPSWFPYTVSM